MEGGIIGVFGSDKELKSGFEASVAKKSEVEGMIVYHRNEAGKRFSLLDDPGYPERIQGYSRIASITDYALYLFPPTGRLTAPDGELAVLLESFALPGRTLIIDGSAGAQEAAAALKGLRVGGFEVEKRSPGSSIIDLSAAGRDESSEPSGSLVYIDRAFSVKGVGTVVLGFVLRGKVSVHDKLRAIPSSPERMVEVKGIQVNDEDQVSAGRGVRVGLSLKGVDAKDLDKTHWLDDGSHALRESLPFRFTKSAFYKQELGGRELHVQLPGELVLAKISGMEDSAFTAQLPYTVPAWAGMRLAVIDLNGKNLRVAGGGSVLPLS